MNVRRPLQAAALALIVLTGVPALSTAPATAAESDGPTTLTLTSSAAKATGIQITITCTISVQNPHKSSHVPGTVNVISRVQCTAPVAGISEGVWLFRDGALVSSRGASNAGVAALQVNTTAACVNGTHLGEGLATVYFPPGFYPPAGTIGMTTLPVPIVC